MFNTLNPFIYLKDTCLYILDLTYSGTFLTKRQSML